MALTVCSNAANEGNPNVTNEFALEVLQTHLQILRNYFKFNDEIKYGSPVA